MITVTQSHSTGDVLGEDSGGITGGSTGYRYGCVYIRECYSLGKISGKFSGGICGAAAAYINGQIHIFDCYSRGVIEGIEAGGITGPKTGWSNGDVYIENTYASGSIDGVNAGGLIGHIPRDRDIVDVKYSVYNDSDTSSIVGDGNGSLLTTNKGNSFDLNDIKGQVYTFDGIRKWSRDTWVIRGNDKLAILRFQVDLRQDITEGNVHCLQYSEETELFWMTCDVLEWKWDSTIYISLGANETFDGRTPDGKGIIDLTGIEEFGGLFRVDKNDVQSFVEAPLIRNVHVKNGTTAEKGGFIVQEEQQYFIVDSCSSTGDIAYKGGGICGRRGGYKGEIKISNSYTTGTIKGDEAGGITGDGVGEEGIAHITQCHSTGDISGNAAGGICGDQTGYANGKVNITQSYSTGDILRKGEED